MTETQIPETNAVPTNAVAPEANAVPYFPHQAPPAVPLTKRAWFLPVALAAAVLVGAGATGAVNGAVASAKAANCKAAFEHTDTAFNAASNIISYLSDGLDYAANRDAVALGNLSPKIETEADRLKTLKEELKTSRDLCEK